MIVLRLLLRAYPAAFRARYGREFLELASHRLDEARHVGPFGVVRFWLAMIVDVARTAPRTRVTTAGIPPHPTDRAMATFQQDLRFAIRGLARRPGFAAVVALTLALGIGANTAIFSVVNAVLYQRLPWPAAERLTVVAGRSADGDEGGLSYPDFVAMRAGAPAFDAIGVMRGQSVTLTGSERPDRVAGMFVTATMLRLFTTDMAAGRAFTEAETELGTQTPVAVLGYEAWQTRFGGDRAVIGRSVTLNGRPFTVIGITPRGLATPQGIPDAWLPLPFYPNAGGLERSDQSLMVIGRLRAGSSVATARAQVAAIANGLAAQFPETNKGISATVRDLKEMLVGDTRQPLTVVMAAVGVLLLIACLNVANLQLARAIARQRETAVRAAIGATRSRLARQLLTESLALAALGGALGIALGYGLLKVLVQMVGTDLPAFGGIAIDGRVLVLAAATTIAAAVVAGLFPAWRTTRPSFGQGLGTRDSQATRGAMRGRSTLVVGQMALSVVLLATAGLLDHSLVAMQRVQPGFDPADRLSFEFRLPATKYDTPAKITAMFERTLAELRALPGVKGAALVRAIPFEHNMELLPTAFDGKPLDDPARALQVHVNVVSDGYFATAGIPMRGGRDLSTLDVAQTPLVVVVNEALAQRVWPGQSAIGKRLRAASWNDWATVVGVVSGAKHSTLTEPVRPQAYVSFRQRPMIFTGVVVHTSGDPMAHAEAVRRAVWRVDADQPVWKLHSMAQSLASSVGPARALASMTTVFALVALTLAAVGVFGVMSFVVAQRRREMGIRIALGARGGQISALVVRHGLRLTAAALLLGLVGAIGAGRLVSTQLYGVSPTDPLTLGIVIAVLATVALIACWLPARRAGRVDPKVSLQAE